MFYPAVFQTGVSTHSRPKAAALFGAKMENIELVSTHSHPKVAAIYYLVDYCHDRVSTHSHPKVAAIYKAHFYLSSECFNTQPPEGGCAPVARERTATTAVSTHSHPKVAASCHRMNPLSYVFQHTATRRWLRVPGAFSNCSELFQHTATRRWLPRKSCVILNTSSVSTHSHPKVAAF